MKRTYYTNGINEKRLYPDEEIPKGWYKGRVKSSITTKDKIFINNGEFEKFISKYDPIPEGFSKGRIKSKLNPDKQSETIKSKEFHHYNNGEKELYLSCNEEIPAGFIRGRLPMSDDQKNKLKNSHLGKTHTEETKRKISYNSNNNRDKAYKTIISKYGSLENFYRMIHVKGDITKKVNKSYNTSKPEIEFYKILCDTYGKENIERNYKSDLYPYRCDFYIKPLDKYIELNLHWTHGYQPYVESNLDCRKQLEIWQEKAKTSQFYRNAIYTWTIRDVEKLKVAKDNNLNYEVIYVEKVLK